MVILQVCQFRIEEAIEFAQDNMSNLKGEKNPKYDQRSKQ